MKLGKMMIFVTDLAEAKQFYGDVLGFRLKSQDERSLEFEQEGCELIAFKCRQKGRSITTVKLHVRCLFLKLHL